MTRRKSMLCDQRSVQLGSAIRAALLPNSQLLGDPESPVWIQTWREARRKCHRSGRAAYGCFSPDDLGALGNWLQRNQAGCHQGGLHSLARASRQGYPPGLTSWCLGRWREGTSGNGSQPRLPVSLSNGWEGCRGQFTVLLWKLRRPTTRSPLTGSQSHPSRRMFSSPVRSWLLGRAEWLGPSQAWSSPSHVCRPLWRRGGDQGTGITRMINKTPRAKRDAWTRLTMGSNWKATIDRSPYNQIASSFFSR